MHLLKMSGLWALQRVLVATAEDFPHVSSFRSNPEAAADLRARLNSGIIEFEVLSQHRILLKLWPQKILRKGIRWNEVIAFLTSD